MPKALIPVPDAYESVTRRVAVDVAAQLARVMKLPEETEVYLPGNAETVPMGGGMFGSCCDPGIKYPAHARLVVTYNEEVSEDHTLVTPIKSNEHIPFFDDPIRDVTIRPVYRFVSLVTTLTYTAPNIVIAQRWLDEMRSQISAMRAELTMTLDYHYALPSPVLALLQHLHETMEASAAPTGLSFPDWFNSYWKVPTTVATTLSNNHDELVIPEHQQDVLGWFDFTTTPENPQRNDGGGTYTASMTYTVHYNRPTQMYCAWPILIHNKPVGKEFRPQHAYSAYRQKPRRVSKTKGTFDALREIMHADNIPYVQYPDIDDWVPKGKSPDTLTFFTGLLMLKPSDPNGVVDLADMGDMTFTPYFLEYMQHQGSRLFKKGQSIFEFRLYENNTELTNVGLRMRPDSVLIEADRPLDMTRYYHIQISLVRNWYRISQDTLQCLRRYPVVYYTTLKALGLHRGKCFKDIKLIGRGVPFTSNSDCPGEGSIIRPPVMGGTWPWPWLGDEWDSTAYPGDMWTGDGWPGGGWKVGSCAAPTWPGIEDNYVWPRGIIPNKDLEEAIKETDIREDHYIDREYVGPLTVLYSQILSSKRRNK